MNKIIASPLASVLGPSLQEIKQMASGQKVATPLNPEIEAYSINLARGIEEPVPVVTLDQQTLLSEGNLSAIVGEPKCKKTFLCSALVGGLLSATGYMGFDAHDKRVLWIDTEQSQAHVYKVYRRTHAIACLDCSENDAHLKVLALRELDPKQRLHVALDAIAEFEPNLVVIDGISDLQYNTNDLEESEHIISELMTYSSVFSMHILCVLHTNPNSDKARGHTGSALQRKAETVMYVHRVGAISVVEPQFCRNEPFERFAFKVNDEGLPEWCDLPTGPIEDSCVSLLREEYGGTVERQVLIRRLVEREGLPASTAKTRIYRAVKRGLLRQSENGREVSVG